MITAKNEDALTLEKMKKLRHDDEDRRYSPVLAQIEKITNQTQALTWICDLQQGDGGKGAMCDYLAQFHNFTVRVQGGDNAGHTSIFSNNGAQIELLTHLIPSGTRRNNVIGVIGNGVLVNAEALTDEIRKLEEIDVNVKSRIFLSKFAHLVFPFHIAFDSLFEAKMEKTSKSIGTTKRGIGPANISKVARIGVRVCDLANREYLKKKLKENMEFFGLPESAVDENIEWIEKYRDLMLSLACDTSALLTYAINHTYSILFEGAQGALIDIEQGTYPFVTSSLTTVAAITEGSGIPISRVNLKIGILKSYQTMVGEGPFVTEFDEKSAESFRKLSNEYEITTHLFRPRRCGWLDLVSAKRSALINDCNALVVTKIDVLAQLEQIKVCVAYQKDGNIITTYTPDIHDLDGCSPVYEKFESWGSDMSKIKDHREFPASLQRFLDFIEAYLDLPIMAVRVGPGENDVIVRNKPLFASFFRK